MQYGRYPFIQDERDQTVDAGFDDIKADDERHQRPYDASGNTHEQGRDDQIGADHDHGHGTGACRQGDDGHFFRLLSPVDISRCENQYARGDHMHENSVQAAGRADGQPLDQRGDDGEDQPCRRTEGKGADQNRDVCGVIL